MLRNNDEGRKFAAAPDAAEATRSTGVSSTALMARFRRDEGGHIGMTFALMVIPCMMMVGMAVDWGRVLHARSQLQGIVDNMALAAGREVQKATSNYDTIAQTTATNFWNAHKDNVKLAMANNTTVTYTSNTSKTEFTLKLTTWVPTPFMTAGGLVAPGAAKAGAPSSCSSSWWQCQEISSSATAMIQAGGSNKDMDVETSLMLDITGSMSGSKITDLKLAAKDLIDIVVWNDQSIATSRVALAPFSAKVNVGTYASAVTGLAATSGSNKLRTCVTERTGFDRYTDAAPGSGSWIGAFNQINGGTSGSNYNSSGSCGSSDPSSDESIMPLTNDKVALKTRIDNFTVTGATAGHLGTAWAWYLLSPNWSSIWPTASKPAPYGDIASNKVRKIAVLMTDGDYNTQYSSISSNTQASALCTAMKAKDIEVFTVGFQVSSSARTLLQNCATDLAHYYDATSGEALRMAFRDIALKISSLRLSQ